MSVTRSWKEGQSGEMSSCVIHFEAIKYYVSRFKILKGVKGIPNNVGVAMLKHVLCAKSTLHTTHSIVYS